MPKASLTYVYLEDFLEYLNRSLNKASLGVVLNIFGQSNDHYMSE